MAKTTGVKVFEPEMAIQLDYLFRKACQARRKFVSAFDLSVYFS